MPTRIGGVRRSAGTTAPLTTDETYSIVLRVATQIVGSHDAEEVAQETFLKLLSSKPPKTPRPWIRTVARNLSIDILRRRRRSIAMENVPEVPVASPDIDELLSVREAISQIPERYRLILWMKEVEGRTAREIATILGTTQQSVELMLFRARRALRESYEPKAPRSTGLLLLLPLQRIKSSLTSKASWIHQINSVAITLSAIAILGTASVGFGQAQSSSSGQTPNSFAATEVSEETAPIEGEGVSESSPIEAHDERLTLSMVLELIDETIVQSDLIIVGRALSRERNTLRVEVSEALKGGNPGRSRNVNLSHEFRIRRNTQLIIFIRGSEEAYDLMRVGRRGELFDSAGRDLGITLDDLRTRIQRALNPRNSATDKNQAGGESHESDRVAGRSFYFRQMGVTLTVHL